MVLVRYANRCRVMALRDEEGLPDTDLSDRNRFARDLAARVRSDLMSLCGQVGALDAVLLELQEQVGCEDVLDPELRDHLEGVRTSLSTACEEAETFVGTLDLPACDTTMKDLLWARIQHAGG